MKKKILSLGIILFFSQTALAVMPPKPEKCPGIQSMQAAGVTDVEQDDTSPNNWYAGIQSINYDTQETWSLAMGPITATNQTDAKNQALAALQTSSLKEGPIPNTRFGVWVCNYKSAAKFSIGALTPSMGINLKAMVK